MKWNGSRTGLISIYLVFSLISVGFIAFPGSLGQPDQGGTRAAKTYIVDINGGGDFTSIQEAIDDAGDGDTIYVWDGVYRENFKINKTINLIGAGTWRTTINGSREFDPVVEITADRVIVTGITVYRSFEEGILIKNANYCSISNISCSNNQNGIRLQDSNYNLIENNTISNNLWRNIQISNSDFNIIKNNRISSQDDFFPNIGIFLFNSFNNIILNNLLDQMGIFILGESLPHWAHTIDNNTVNDKPIVYWKDTLGGIVSPGAGQIIIVNCSEVLVENQNCSNGTIGISIAYSNNITVRNNTCIGNSLYGIYLRAAKWNDIENNSVRLNQNGIYLNGGSKLNNISNNIVNDIYLMDSNLNLLINNICSGNYGGIFTYNSSFNTISENSLYDISSGIFIQFSKNNTISKNLFYLNSSGIYLDFSKSNTISNNFMFSGNLKIMGDELSHWVSNNFDLNLTIDGKVIKIIKNLKDKIISNVNGYTLYLNCSNITFINITNELLIMFSNNIIFRNCMFNNTDNGLKIKYSEYIDIENNSFNYVSNGLVISESEFCSMKNNRFIGNDNGIYLSGSKFNQIKFNEVVDGNTGMRISYSEINYIENNKFYGNVNGIIISESNLIELDNNNFSSHQIGITMDRANSNIISNNSFLNKIEFGIKLGDSISNVINGNIFSQLSDIGIDIDNSNSNVISNNSFLKNNGSGISLKESSQNVIKMNTMTEGYYGINILPGSNNNLVFENTFYFIWETEIRINVGTTNNMIFHNHFFSTQYIRDIGSNYWNNSNQEGNYWSDYTGVDNGANGRPRGDGIGDTKIPHQGVDYYPFVNSNATEEDDKDGDGEGEIGIASLCGSCNFLLILLLIILLILFILFKFKWGSTTKVDDKKKKPRKPSDSDESEPDLDIKVKGLK